MISIKRLTNLLLITGILIFAISCKKLNELPEVSYSASFVANGESVSYVTDNYKFRFQTGVSIDTSYSEDSSTIQFDFGIYHFDNRDGIYIYSNIIPYPKNNVPTDLVKNAVSMGNNIPDGLKNNSVFVVYKKSNDNFNTSRGLVQDSSYFSILEINHFVEKGRNVLEFKADFECNVANVHGDKINLKDGHIAGRFEEL